MSDAILKGMVLDAPDQVITIGLSIDSVTEQITDLESKRDSLKTSVCDKIATDIENYLIGTKFDPVDYSLTKGANFNQCLVSSGSIVDWEVIDSTSHSVVYTYIPLDDTIIDDFKEKWDFTHDYLVLPLGTYGILDNIDKLNLAKTILTKNKDKVNDSISYFTPFL